MRRPVLPNPQLVFALTLLFYAGLSPLTAAHATTVGAVIGNGAKSYASLPVLMNVMAYTIAFMLSVVGLNKFKQHADRPDQVPFSSPALYMIGAAVLAALPYAIGMMLRTLEIDSAGGSKSATTIALKTSGDLGLDVMMARFIQDIRSPVSLLIWSLSLCLGMFFMISGFMRLARGATQDGPRGSLGSGTLGRIVIGSILFSVAASTDAFTNSLFGGSVVQFKGMSISGVTSDVLDRANQAVASILIFVQILGFFAFMRGFLMLRSLADGNTSVSTAAAATHIIGGALAINISSMLNVLQNTACGSVADCKVLKF